MTDTTATTDAPIPALPVNLFEAPVGKLPANLPEVEPTYDSLYVIRIVDCNPKKLVVSVKRLDTTKKQAELNQADLDAADNGPDWPNPKQPDWPGAGDPKGKLHRRLRAKKAALVVFHLVDPQATFIVDGANSPGSAIMTADAGDPQILRRPMWVAGLNRAHTAVSVVLWRKPPGNGAAQIEEHDFAIGIDVKDVDTGEITAIYIDPKIENDGGG